jgi:endoribonuclease Dicer
MADPPLQTHSSIQVHEGTSYGRLEFIGDAILDFSEFIFRCCTWRCPSFDDSGDSAYFQSGPDIIPRSVDAIKGRFIAGTCCPYCVVNYGELMIFQGAMVSNSALAAVCVSSRLREHLHFESYQLAGSIEVYANELKTRQQKEYLAAEGEGRSPGQYWLGIEPPKVHACFSASPRGYSN